MLTADRSSIAKIISNGVYQLQQDVTKPSLEADIKKLLFFLEKDINIDVLIFRYIRLCHTYSKQTQSDIMRSKKWMIKLVSAMADRKDCELCVLMSRIQPPNLTRLLTSLPPDRKIHPDDDTQYHLDAETLIALEDKKNSVANDYIIEIGEKSMNTQQLRMEVHAVKERLCKQLDISMYEVTDIQLKDSSLTIWTLVGERVFSSTASDAFYHCVLGELTDQNGAQAAFGLLMFYIYFEYLLNKMSSVPETDNDNTSQKDEEEKTEEEEEDKDSIVVLPAQEEEQVEETKDLNTSIRNFAELHKGELVIPEELKDF